MTSGRSIETFVPNWGSWWECDEVSIEGAEEDRAELCDASSGTNEERKMSSS